MQTAERVVVVGQGYVGLPLAMRAVEVGYDVVGLEKQELRVADLAEGRSHVEDISDEVLQTALATGRYLPTTDTDDCAGFDIAVVSVPTPLKDGLPDLSFIESAGEALAEHLRPGATVILESTTYPGTTEELLIPILEAGSGLKAGTDFHVGFSPERIDPGNKTHTFVTTPKVTSGIDEPSLQIVDEFFGRLVERTVPVSSPEVAELVKLLENTFRHVNIALVNELAVYAHDLDIDIHEAVDAASTKPFGYMPFRPGPGVGGHCLPVDPSYLSWRVRKQLGRTFRFVELANDVNDHMPDYVVTRVVAALNEREKAVKGTRILVLGLSYKRNTGDMRESPSLRIVELLQYLGADLRAVEPHIQDFQMPEGLQRADLTVEEIEDAELVLLLTDHDEFDYDLVEAHAAAVLDTRYRMSGPRVEQL